MMDGVPELELAGGSRKGRAMECACCRRTISEENFYMGSSSSRIYPGSGRIPICRDCVEGLYEHYAEYYAENGYADSERRAVARLCMALDIYYDASILQSAAKRTEKKDVSLIRAYLQQAALNQNKGRNFDDTILAWDSGGGRKAPAAPTPVKPETVAFFGSGFSEGDYLFLQEQYDDWTTRHECKTKVQEEVFKQICFTQLELLKATRAGEDTKDLTFTFQKLLETANLQPKQNAKDALSDSQTFGTLIDKWENTRPVPETDEDLKDVDKIGLYIDVFFKGHLAKMLDLKNGVSGLYDRFMEKYTVRKPEYGEDGDALFDAVFGSVMEGDE